MHLLLIIVAWFAIFTEALTLVLMPLLFGHQRTNYSYGTWLSAAFGAFIVSLLAFKVLGFY